MKNLVQAMCLALGCLAALGTVAKAEPFIGEIKYFAGNFPPRGWAFCDGQLLSISSNTALFSILGTTYGGDGETTFALPDMRGRVPVHSGQTAGPGLSPRPLGQKSGIEDSFLLTNNLPSHNHTASSTATSAMKANPGAPQSGAVGKGIAGGAAIFSGIGGSNQALKNGVVTTDVTTTVNNTGAGQPFTNMQPFLSVNCIIALVGIYPSPN